MFQAVGQPAWTAVLFIVQGDTTGLSIAQIVQADLATIGVKLDVQQISSVESGQHAFAGDYQMSYDILGNCGKYMRRRRPICRRPRSRAGATLSSTSRGSSRSAMTLRWWR